MNLTLLDLPNELLVLIELARDVIPFSFTCKRLYYLLKDNKVDNEDRVDAIVNSNSTLQYSQFWYSITFSVEELSKQILSQINNNYRFLTNNTTYSAIHPNPEYLFSLLDKDSMKMRISRLHESQINQILEIIPSSLERIIELFGKCVNSYSKSVILIKVIEKDYLLGFKYIISNSKYKSTHCLESVFRMKSESILKYIIYECEKYTLSDDIIPWKKICQLNDKEIVFLILSKFDYESIDKIYKRQFTKSAVKTKDMEFINNLYRMGYLMNIDITKYILEAMNENNTSFIEQLVKIFGLETISFLLQQNALQTQNMEILISLYGPIEEWSIQHIKNLLLGCSKETKMIKQKLKEILNEKTKKRDFDIEDKQCIKKQKQ